MDGTRAIVGRRPVVEGDVRVGDDLVVHGWLQLRGRLAAGPSGVLRIGDRAFLNEGAYLYAARSGLRSVTAAEIEIDETGGIHVARLEGELDLSNVVDLGDALASAVPEEALGLVVDMAGIRHIDSAGVRMVFDLRRRLRQRRQGFALAVPSNARIRDVLELAAVGDTVPLLADVDTAVEAVRAD